MKEYDEFKIGDRIWSELCGFTTITDNNTVQGYFLAGAFSMQFRITPDGRLFTFEKRPRIFFHAVADTDDDMRVIVKNGMGLRRINNWEELIKNCTEPDFSNLVIKILAKSHSNDILQKLIIQNIESEILKETEFYRKKNSLRQESEKFSGLYKRLIDLQTEIDASYKRARAWQRD
ncbi:hypothetical protein [Microcystis phage Mel-JY01]